MENAKNLKAYEEKRKRYQQDLKRLQDLSPDLSKDEMKDLQDEYDEEGWKSREKKHEELKHSIEKAKDRKLGSKEAAKLKKQEKREGKEGRESGIDTLKNRTTAIKAIKRLEKNGLLADALLLAEELIENNPEDDECNAVFMSIFNKINGEREQQSLKEQGMFSQFEQIADLMMNADQELNREAKRLQTEDSALRLMTENIQKHHGIKDQKTRSGLELTEKTKSDEEVQEVTEQYLEQSDKDKTMDQETLKGQDAIVINMESERTNLDETALRAKVQKEQARNKEGHGGSAKAEFRRRKGEDKSMDHREARAIHESDELKLADQMVSKIIQITHPGQTPSAEILEMAREVALARIRKKETEKIEHMSSEAK
jgi:hypothetical protein